MHYLEDLIEFLDDLPEELQHRLNQIREWDAAVEEMQIEVKDMQEQLFGTDCVATKEEKERMALSIADKYGTMKLLSKKKHELVERCTALMKKLYTRAHESQEAFEAELAVDNPGVVEVIQSRFNRKLAARQYEDMCSSEAATPFESDESGRSTPDLLVPNLLDVRNVLKDQNSKIHQFGIGKGKQFLVDAGKKRPGRKPGKDGKISAYMRKKHERLREEEAARQRLVQVRREEEMRQQQCHMSSSTFGTFNGSTPGGIVSKVEPDNAMDEDDPAMALFNDLADMLGPDDQIRDDVDLTPVNSSINFLSHLDAGEREIVELMNNSSGYFHDDDLMTGLGAASTSQSPMYASFSGSHPSTMRNSNSPVKPSASSSGYSSTGEPYTDEKKRKKVMFSITTDTSLHGRPRKLTDRAAQNVQQTMEKLTKKREDEMDLQERANWCFCGRPDDYSEMIGCDNPKCQYQWYHMICVNVEEPPAGLWYCPSCQPNRSQAAQF